MAAQLGTLLARTMDLDMPLGMSPGGVGIGFGAETGPAVDMSVITDLSNFRGTGTCFADVKCDADGDWYESNNAGTFGASEGSWLDNGLNSEVWVERTVDLGTLSTDWGAGRLICSSDRILGVQQASTGVNEATVTIEFFDADVDGNSLGSKQIVLTADRG